MGIKAGLSIPYAKVVAANIKKWSADPIRTQHKVLHNLMHRAAITRFGNVHDFLLIKTYEDFKEKVPVRDYEGFRDYIEDIKDGENNVLWPGRPIYFSKTSGTTSGTKYIPITEESMPNHIDSARNAFLCYIAETGKADFVNGKMIFLQGSPVLDTSGSVPTGRLSGIVANHVPAYLQKNRLPGFETNSIDDWETKVKAITDETADVDMTLVGGIPSWVQMYFELVLEKTGKKTIGEVWPNFQVLVKGGVNFEPYRANFDMLIGKAVDEIEFYPASEGFIAFQDSQEAEGMLLVLNKGIFYEFIPMAEYHNENPSRISLEDVKVGVNYAIVLNTNAGLWGYLIGDTVQFVSTEPYRLIVTGRIAQYTSAFGEHVIASEVESSMQAVASGHGAQVVDFHVAPQVNPPEGELPYHEWFIEFGHRPENMELFRDELDNLMQEKNIYYRDLLEGNILQTLKITPVQKDGFVQYMKSKGKLGGQNKVPRLSNDRSVGDELVQFAENQ